MSVLQPQGSITGNIGFADVIWPRWVLPTLEERLLVNGGLQLDIHGLVSCLFPRKTSCGIDSWTDATVKSWRNVHNVYRNKFFAESQGTEENNNGACAGYLEVVDPALVQDKSANVIFAVPQFVWNDMRALYLIFVQIC